MHVEIWVSEWVAGFWLGKEMWYKVNIPSNFFS
jgi:hypothetical protein